MAKGRKGLCQRKAVWLSFTVVALATVSGAATDPTIPSGTDGQPQVVPVRIKRACESVTLLNLAQATPTPAPPVHSGAETPFAVSSAYLEDRNS